MNNPTPAFISLDWGTSSFRAYLVDQKGHIIATRASTGGILSVADRGFDQVMETHINDWPTELPLMASGMITSRQGWHELPYLACPVTLSDLAAALHPITSNRGRKIYFIPGITCQHGDGTPDVARGEETQVFGSPDLSDACFITPGTHSKWLTLKQGAITGFTTYMTGELFALLKTQSILARLLPQDAAPHSQAAFARGVAVSLNNPAALLATLFSVRTLPLMDQMPAPEISSYLSGLLIGAEVADARHHHPQGTTFRILATAQLTSLYAHALQLAGLTTALAPENIVVSGQQQLAQVAGIL